jgi:hypothetical protein
MIRAMRGLSEAERARMLAGTAEEFLGAAAGRMV